MRTHAAARNAAAATHKPHRRSVPLPSSMHVGKAFTLPLAHSKDSRYPSFMAATYFEGRRGRRTFPERNASQISFGDASANSPIEKEEGPVRRQAQASAPVAWQQQQQQRHEQVWPTRRPRGPGTAFAAHIEANGFPAAASRRSACVDVVPECLYQYDTSKLHTHKKLAQMPNRVKQCDRNLQLFLRPEEQVARSAAAAVMLGEWRDRQLFYSRYPSVQAHEHSRDPRMIADVVEAASSPLLHAAPYDRVMMADRRPCLPYAPAAELDDSPLLRRSLSTYRLRRLKHLYQRERNRPREASRSAERDVDAVLEEDARARHGQAAVSTLPSGTTAHPPSHGDVSADVAANVPPLRRRAERSSVRRDDGDGAVYAHPLHGRDWQPWEREYACEAPSAAPRTRSSFHASAPISDSNESRDGHNDRYGGADHAPANSLGSAIPSANWRCASAPHPRQATGSYAEISDSTEVRSEPPRHTTRIGARIAVADAAPQVPHTSAWFAPLRNDRVARQVHRTRSADHARASHALREEKERQAGQLQRHISTTSPAAQGSSSSTTAGARPAETSPAASARTQATVTLADVCTHKQLRTPSLQQRQHWQLAGSAASSTFFPTSSARVQGRGEAALTLRDVCRALNASAVMM
ncbi:hypothetical protein, unknown function [Leishmania mexicana MHOM/GT/2001/U1103]|uniref:Uncharacterized protein n=1 Tax=Leishmania mexicana (strain MHOM/GT/2001/U1103) TaxID=929439 RepID=E9AWS1_LEIMU|nr:hypothetical protein, unknown function [Leishmania mexicana MHOM/GT/2001/U1103]CBZ27407.1 hypothetical protein, unknown function [Leishmania mexicana MHOM/GT/2001/U1103]